MPTQATASPASAKSNASGPSQSGDASLADRYQCVRQFSEQLAEPLSPEDCGIQSMPDASPVKWHLAHTTWFFETFLLKDRPGYERFDDRFTHLFNSYYNAVGEQFTRSQRGVLSRPSFDEMQAYRRHVDQHMATLLDSPDEQIARIVEIGLHHEQQHQELILTDIKHALSQSPLRPVYQAGEFVTAAGNASDGDWLEFDEGVYEIGHPSSDQVGEGFAFDNESPRHRVFVDAFQIADRPVTCGEYCRFIEDGGYQRPELWLSLGWATVSEHGWQAPYYWRAESDSWRQFTLAGDVEVNPAAPVCHVSYFEADAYARWAGARLPTEAEWEVAEREVAAQEVASTASTGGLPSAGGFVDQLLAAGAAVHPGRTWEWTASPYTAYPGYQAPDGALGEYNGKFMCNQFVLRGGSCATHSSHIRSTYRNFFPPEARWQFTGIRLCR
ncbi:MAG: ergothioneine biosynthesis protein EgtB [Planctomycetota bacterium]